MIAKPLAARLAAATIVCLFLSTVVPIWAAVTPGQPSLPPKIIDGALAVALFVLLVVLHRLAGSRVTRDIKAEAFEVCRWLAVLPLLLFAIYALGADLKWEVLLIGLGWRSWYLVTVVPLIFTVRRRT